jgi:hypothetical protein
MQDDNNIEVSRSVAGRIVTKRLILDAVRQAAKDWAAEQHGGRQ